MKKHFVLLSAIFLACAFNLSASYAEEAAPPKANEAAEPFPYVGQEADTDFGYGTVASLADGSIVVNEYDYVDDRDVPVTYLTDANLKLEHVSSLAEISIGDMVDVVYTRRDQNKVADSISVTKPEKPAEVPLDDLKSGKNDVLSKYDKKAPEAQEDKKEQQEEAGQDKPEPAEQKPQ